MKALIATNGGDTCALNASLWAIRDSLLAYGPTTSVLGATGGYKGLIDGQIQDITNVHINPFHGGSILKSLRESPCKKTGQSYEIDQQKADKIVHHLRDKKINVLIVIGGDGTLRATKMFYNQVAHKYNFRVFGFLKTIDNDVKTYTMFRAQEAALCPGFPTAARRIYEIAKRMRTTAETTERIFTVETMGRDAGWLAAATAIGGADQVVIPETKITKDVLTRLAKEVKRSYSTARNAIVGVSEGVVDVLDKSAIQMIHGSPQRPPYSTLGPRKTYGAGVEIATALSNVLSDVEIRCHETGYEPRAGAPTSYDVKISKLLGWRVGQLVRDGNISGVVPTLSEVKSYDELSENDVQVKDINDIDKMKFPTAHFYSTDDLNVTDLCIHFLKTITDCPSERDAGDLLRT